MVAHITIAHVFGPDASSCGRPSAEVDYRRGVLAAVVFVPSAPLLVPQLAGPSAADTAPVRTAALRAVAGLAATSRRWVIVGADADERDVARVGTFRGFGVDVVVSLAPVDGRDHPADPGMPLSLLIGGWLRGRVGADVTARPLLVAPDLPPADCAARGAALRAELDADAEPVGVLVVADGSTRLGDTAPGGGFSPECRALQDDLDAAVGTGDRDGLIGLSVGAASGAGIGGRAAFQVAAGLDTDGRFHGETYYAAAPFGVGYIVARWSVGGAS
ncbi:class III extradiol ring-cleavage dioxygenase family protein [Williamsia sterculiae]|uniref:Uncharacterized protein n=1 Tax=Williamsia sterculiae TaxID=1344003 RepID=A0A1N7EEI0_9NOCA|nr:hypothetical protein SAMN05445060_1205 [Williamsia sterculiae]